MTNPDGIYINELLNKSQCLAGFVSAAGSADAVAIVIVGVIHLSLEKSRKKV